MTVKDRLRTTYRYKVYGLQIASDIMLPELITTSDPDHEPEVVIRLGKVPGDIENTVSKTRSFQLARGQFLLRVPGIGNYYVTKGNRIVVEPAEQADEGPVRLFLLGTAFGALLMQRGILPMHGSAVVINGSCIIFTGLSGSGKSTLLAAFRKCGCLFLADDVAAVTVGADGVARVQPAYPQQKLWSDTAENMGVDTKPLRAFYRGTKRDKFAVPVPQDFCPAPMPLAAVYELTIDRPPAVTITPLAGVDKLSVLLRHTYRPWLIEGLGLKAAHFKLCAKVAGQITVSRMNRPEGIFSTQAQVQLIEQNLERYSAARA